MAYQDQTLKCKDCGNDFVWTASEQEFYAQKGFEHAPQRCPACRAAKKQQMRGDRQMHTATCADCGAECQVPFMPRGDKPVYCNACYQKHNTR
ncbi:MAG: zinc-ribbon domain containing protein [Patescibacteria group bacterium]|jgi:CxxC-x17-CxxC domain-containing protein